MSHTPHPDLHEFGLADNCERCDEIARSPLSELDTPARRDLIQRTLANRFGGDGSEFGDPVAPRSDNEAYAMAKVMTALEHAGQIAEVSPELLILYLQQRWRVTIQSA